VTLATKAVSYGGEQMKVGHTAWDMVDVLIF
jgi:hypothetical protein